MTDEILALIWGLAVIVLVLVLAYLFTRYVAGRGMSGPVKGRYVKVLEAVSVGREQKLLLVQVGDQIHLLGVTAGRITELQTVGREEFDHWRESAGQSPAPESVSFQEALRRVLQQRRKSR